MIYARKDAGLSTICARRNTCLSRIRACKTYAHFPLTSTVLEHRTLEASNRLTKSSGYIPCTGQTSAIQPINIFKHRHDEQRRWKLSSSSVHCTGCLRIIVHKYKSTEKYSAHGPRLGKSTPTITSWFDATNPSAQSKNKKTPLVQYTNRSKRGWTANWWRTSTAKTLCQIGLSIPKNLTKRERNISHSVTCKRKHWEKDKEQNDHVNASNYGSYPTTAPQYYNYMYVVIYTFSNLNSCANSCCVLKQGLLSSWPLLTGD